MFVSAPSSRPISALADEITSLAAHISAATCRWLLLIAEFDERAGYREWGQASCADWVAWQCSVSRVTAREHVRIARWLGTQPVLCDAFARGELSYSKVRALSRFAEVDRPEELLLMAQHATAAQLERMVAGARRVTRQEADRRQQDRYFDLFFDDDGSAVLRGRLPAEDGALLLTALQHALTVVGAVAVDGDSAEAQEAPRARNADALVRLADAALAVGGAERTGGDRTQVVVHVDVATLSADEEAIAPPDAADVLATEVASRAAPRQCRVANGPALAAETARRLCCDAGIVTVAERAGETLSVGRKTRSIPPALRRALRRRDGGCRFPGCTRDRWLDAHHVQHWAHGGSTSLDNLVHLCRHHHRLVHEGGYVLRWTRDHELEVVRPDGRRLLAAAPPRRGSCERLLGDQRRSGVDPGPGALRPRTTERSYDLGMAVDNVLAWLPPPVT